MTKSKMLDATEVPLLLVPKTIAGQLRTFGGSVYRISVKRTRWHHYNVTVRTKSVRREVRPETVAVVEKGPVNSRGVRVRDAV